MLKSDAFDARDRLLPHCRPRRSGRKSWASWSLRIVRGRRLTIRHRCRLQPAAESSPRPADGGRRCSAASTSCARSRSRWTKKPRCFRSAPKGADLEAFMVRLHPQWIKARDFARRGKSAAWSPSSLCFHITTSIRATSATWPTSVVAPRTTSAAIRSCRPLHLWRRARACSGRHRSRSEVWHRPHHQRGDRFREGRHLTFTVSTQATPYQRVHILGTKGRLEVQIPFNAPQDGRCEDLP